MLTCRFFQSKGLPLVGIKDAKIYEPVANEQICLT